jgi:hypothetical protein
MFENDGCYVYVVRINMGPRCVYFTDERWNPEKVETYNRSGKIVIEGKKRATQTLEEAIEETLKHPVVRAVITPHIPEEPLEAGP